MKNYTGQFLPMERPVFFISVAAVHTQKKATVI